MTAILRSVGTREKEGMKNSGSQNSESSSHLIDAGIHESEKINEKALKTLVRAAVTLNQAKARR